MTSTLTEPTTTVRGGNGRCAATEEAAAVTRLQVVPRHRADLHRRPVRRAIDLDAHGILQDQRRHLRREQDDLLHETLKNYDNVLGRNNYFIFIFDSFWVALWATVFSLISAFPPRMR